MSWSAGRTGWRTSIRRLRRCSRARWRAAFWHISELGSGRQAPGYALLSNRRGEGAHTGGIDSTTDIIPGPRDPRLTYNAPLRGKSNVDDYEQLHCGSPCPGEPTA